MTKTEDFNKEMLRVLKGKGREAFIKEIEVQGYSVITNHDDSRQGYPLVEFNGRKLVISKDYNGKAGLFKPYSHVTDYKNLKYVDYHNYFTKKKYPKLEPEEEAFYKNWKLKKVILEMKSLKRDEEKIKELQNELEYHKKIISKLKSEYKELKI